MAEYELTEEGCNFMLKLKCFIVGGMILSSSLQVKAFTPASNTAACAAVAAAAAHTAHAARVANAAANKEREQDKNKEPDIVTTVFGFTALLCFSAALFMYLFQLVGLFLEKKQWHIKTVMKL